MYSFKQYHFSIKHCLHNDPAVYFCHIHMKISSASWSWILRDIIYLIIQVLDCEDQSFISSHLHFQVQTITYLNSHASSSSSPASDTVVLLSLSLTRRNSGSFCCCSLFLSSWVNKNENILKYEAHMCSCSDQAPFSQDYWGQVQFPNDPHNP